MRLDGAGRNAHSPDHDEFAFFDDYLRPAYEAGGASQARGWCSRWWEHRSARFRVRSMWQAYEALACKDAATCDEVFLRTVGDHHMALLMGEKSPMYTSVHPPAKQALQSGSIEGGEYPTCASAQYGQ